LVIVFGKGRLVESLAAGAGCDHCGEDFDEQGGFLLPSLNGPPLAFHHDCLQRTIVGGVNHQRGRCTCCGGDQPPDPPSLSKRDAATTAAKYFRLHCRGKP
jgi:hypothetical protein